MCTYFKTVVGCDGASPLASDAAQGEETLNRFICFFVL